MDDIPQFRGRTHAQNNNAQSTSFGFSTTSSVPQYPSNIPKQQPYIVNNTQNSYGYGYETYVQPTYEAPKANFSSSSHQPRNFTGSGVSSGFTHYKASKNEGFSFGCKVFTGIIVFVILFVLVITVFHRNTSPSFYDSSLHMKHHLEKTNEKIKSLKAGMIKHEPVKDPDYRKDYTTEEYEVEYDKRLRREIQENEELEKQRLERQRIERETARRMASERAKMEQIYKEKMEEIEKMQALEAERLRKEKEEAEKIQKQHEQWLAEQKRLQEEEAKTQQELLDLAKKKKEEEEQIEKIRQQKEKILEYDRRKRQELEEQKKLKEAEEFQKKYEEDMKKYEEELRKHEEKLSKEREEQLKLEKLHLEELARLEKEKKDEEERESVARKEREELLKAVENLRKQRREMEAKLNEIKEKELNFDKELDHKGKNMADDFKKLEEQQRKEYEKFLKEREKAFDQEAHGKYRVHEDADTLTDEDLNVLAEFSRKFINPSRYYKKKGVLKKRKIGKAENINPYMFNMDETEQFDEQLYGQQLQDQQAHDQQIHNQKADDQQAYNQQAAPGNKNRKKSRSAKNRDPVGLRHKEALEALERANHFDLYGYREHGVDHEDQFGHWEEEYDDNEYYL